jgi:hypothetical protein
MKMHIQCGRNSAGPRESRRVLDRDEVLGRRDRRMQQTPSAERSAALTTIRAQLRSIDRRVSRG